MERGGGSEEGEEGIGEGISSTENRPHGPTTRITGKGEEEQQEEEEGEEEELSRREEVGEGGIGRIKGYTAK